MPHEHAACARCGAFWDAALRHAENVILCANCAARRHRRGWCLICHECNVPLEAHHIAGRRYHTATMFVCLNCHARVSDVQQREWPALLASQAACDNDEAMARLVLGCGTLGVTAWSNATLTTPSRWRQLLRMLPVVLALAHPFILKQPYDTRCRDTAGDARRDPALALLRRASSTTAP